MNFLQALNGIDMQGYRIAREKKGVRFGVNGIALFIGVFLLVAAYGKWFHPVEMLKTWDQTVALLEIVFVLCLWFFRYSSLTWFIAATLFSSWAGYALFWYRLDLPCYCLGEALQIPTLFALSFDALFFTVSVLIASVLGGAKWMLGVCLALSVSGLAIAFLIAQKIYATVVQPLL